MRAHYWTRKDGRYFAAFIEKDLLDDWTVVKVWGGLGWSQSQSMIVQCEDRQACMQYVATIAKVRAAHGYEKFEPWGIFERKEMAANSCK